MTQVSEKLVILSGPSGAGKSTVLKQLLADCPLPLMLSVSATTRPARPGEQDGVDYHFLTHGQFAHRRQTDAFLEAKEVFGQGHWYGTLRSEVKRGLAAGHWVVLEIDVAGARAVLEQVPEAVTIFLHPGSMEELEKRLRQRGTESPESLARRLQVAQNEIDQIPLYRYEVINDQVTRAVSTICDILTHEKQSGDHAHA